MLSEIAHQDEDLVKGTQLLRGQYEIYGPLAKGGFGITYLARDSLDRKVVIKECFPTAFCTRMGAHVTPARPDLAPEFTRSVKQFKSEALRLAALNHPRIVSVHQVFEENGTAFLAMEHIDGDDLFTIAEEQPDRLDAATLKTIATEALEAVGYIHDQGLLHRDLAPDNIVLDADAHVTLIDFGAATEITSCGDAENAKLLLVKDGYSPYEFYVNDVQDASSDLYALAATFHYIITGYAPPDSPSRMAAIEAGQHDPFMPLTTAAWGADQGLLDAINAGLAMERDRRPPSVEAWLDLIHTERSDAPVSAAPAPRVRHEPIIADEISQLVSATNSALAKRVSERRKKDAQKNTDTQLQDDARVKQKQLVDLFGNPIDDVDAFLREQDEPPQKATPEECEITPEPQVAQTTEQDAEPDRPSMVRGLLDRIRPRKRNMPSAIPQN